MLFFVIRSFNFCIVFVSLFYPGKPDHLNFFSLGKASIKVTG